MPDKSENPDATAPGDLEQRLDEVRDAIVADPELADEARAVLEHLRRTPIDPVGDPNDLAP